MMPVMMMTVVIIYHNSLQEQITQDNLSLFYFEPNQQILQTTPTIMLHYKFHRFLLFPPVHTGGNLLFILREIQTEFSKRFPSREILPQM